jgi:hypothetical protein
MQGMRAWLEVAGIAVSTIASTSLKTYAVSALLPKASQGVRLLCSRGADSFLKSMAQYRDASKTMSSPPLNKTNELVQSRLFNGKI